MVLFRKKSVFSYADEGSFHIGQLKKAKQKQNKKIKVLNQLKYGRSEIRINYTNNQLRSYNRKEVSIKQQQFNSFTDQNVYVSTCNYRESLFQILPRGSFDIHDEYVKSEQKDQLKPRLKTELDQYKLVIQNKMNEDILFGSETVFKHVDSDYFLVGSYNCSEFSTDAFKLELSEHLSSQAVFKILPFNTYQQIGHTIHLNEPCTIEHEKTKTKIDYIKNKKIFLDLDIQSDLEYKLRPKIRKGYARYEAIITHNCTSQWVFQLHEVYNSHIDKFTIKQFDLCVFRNTENSSYLSASDTRIIMKKNKTDDIFDFPLDSIWEILQVSKQQQKSFSITSATSLVPTNQYTFRHYMSGRYMTNFCSLSPETNNSGLKIQILTKGKDNLQNNCFAKIQYNNLDLQILQKQLVQSQDESEMFYKGLDPQDIDHEEYDVAFKLESHHAFQILKVNKQIRQDYLYVLSAQELLCQFSDVLKLAPEIVEQTINSKILSQVVLVLQRLLNFVNTPKRQRFMKELKMIEILMEIIYFMSYKNGLERLFMNWKSDRERTKNIFKLTYMIIEQIIKNNPPIKLHVSQWMELFLHSALMIDDPSVQNCLSELLNNNYQAISKFINKQSIKRLIDIMRLQVPHEKYLKILSSICICNGKSIIQNQINALTLFFYQIQKESQFQIKLDEQIPIVYCYIRKQNPDWRTLIQFYDDSKDQDNLQSWNYFLAYLNLLGDVSANRNKFAKKYTEEHIQLSVLCSMLEDPVTLQLNALVPVLKVIHGAYVDCQYYTPIRRLARVREWETIEKKNDILRTHAEDKLKPENCDLKRVLKFVEQYIQNFSNFVDKDANNNLCAILEVLKTTLRLGFWLSINNLIDMLPHLFRLLSKEDKVHVQQEIQCKTILCEVLDIIMDMETNVRVSKTTQNLKRMLNQIKQPKPVEETPKEMTQSIQKKHKTNDLQYLQGKAKRRGSFLPVLSPGKSSEKFDFFKDMANVLKKEITDKDQIYNVDEWIRFDKQLIESRHIFVKLASEPTIEYIIQRLSKYEDAQLSQYSLQLLNRVYGQRRELAQNFEKVIIVATGVTWTLSVESRVTRTKLLAIVDRNILQCNLENQKDYNISIWRESDNPKESGIIQDLHYLVETMKHNPKRKECLYDNLYPENALNIIYDETEQSHKLHQSLLKWQDLHESIIPFIEITNKQQQNPLIMKLLHSCYRFLTMLIWNHLENKFDFIKHRHLMYNHIQYNIGCIDFFKELFQNNKTLLYSEKDVITVAKLVIQYCNQLSIKQYYKSKLLEFLRVLLIYNNKMIKYNQILVMSLLQEKQNNNLMYILNPTLNEENNLYSLKQVYNDIQVYQQSNTITPELTYMFTFFSLFTLLVEDQNDTNSGKCKQMHTYSELLKILSETQDCWPLKRYLRSYINRLYYSCNDYDNVSQLLVEIDLNNIITDLDLFIEQKWQNNIIQIQNPVRYCYINSYIYLCLEETLITLNTILSKEKFLGDLEDILYQNFSNQIFITHFQLFELAQKLQQVRKIYKAGRQIDFMSKSLISIFKCMFQTFDISVLLIREGLMNEGMQCRCITERYRITRRRFEGDQVITETIKEFETRATTSDLMQQGEQQTKDQLIENIFETQNQVQTQRKIQSLKKMFIKDEEDINETLNQKHRRLVNILNTSQRFQRFMEEEFMIVCDKFQNIPVDALKEFIKNSITLSLNNKSVNDELKGFLLKLLTRLITVNQKKDILLPIDQWTPDDWTHCRQDIEKQQIFLAECGAAELICQMIQEPNLETRLQLTGDLLTFSIAFLIGGNTQCQNSILHQLRNDKQNIMFQNFASLIKKISRAIYNNYKIRKPKCSESLFNMLTIDNYDHLELDSKIMKRMNVIEHDEAKEKTFKQQAIQTMCRSFRVLQLLCENNNVDMKNYMRIQTDSDGSSKLNSINFIELTTTQLRLFLKILSKPIIVIPQYMIEFLIEIIQLPCLENQIMLCKTTFYEDSCYMSRFFQKQENHVTRLFEKQDDLWDLQDLYNKILISILSVLEGNDDKIYEDLQNKLEPQFIIDFINQNLHILQVNSLQDVKQLLQLQDQMFTTEIQRILNVVIIKLKIQDKFPKSGWIQELNKLQDENQKEVFQLLEGKIKNIEIIYNGKNQKIFFPSHPLFEYLSDQTKDKMMYEVSRDTQREKIIGLIEAKQMIFNEIEYNYSLNQLMIPITHQLTGAMLSSASMVSIIINIMMILFYSIEVKYKTALFKAEDHEEVILSLLSFIQLLLTSTYIVLFLISRIPLVLKSMPEKQYRYKFYKWLDQTIFILHHEDDIIGLGIYLIFSLLGQYKQYYFSIHLIHLFSRMSLLRNVFQAISYNAKQLVVVALLGVLFVYVFSITGFNQYVDEIYTMDLPEESCNTLISCMITLITSGVIGTSMSHWDPIKFILDTLYFVFFALLFSNIVSGIMIDTFAELRDKRVKIEDDMKNFCYICGIDKQTLEKNLEEFDDHIQGKHYLWNYIFYMYILLKKDSTEYTGLEYCIFDKLKNDDITWFPIITDRNIISEQFQDLESQVQQLYKFMSQKTEDIVNLLEQNIIKI